MTIKRYKMSIATRWREDLEQITCGVGSGDPGTGSNGVYAATLKPKKSWPNGRLRAAGTLTSASKVSFETILC